MNWKAAGLWRPDSWECRMRSSDWVPIYPRMIHYEVQRSSYEIAVNASVNRWCVVSLRKNAKAVICCTFSSISEKWCREIQHKTKENVLICSLWFTAVDLPCPLLPNTVVTSGDSDSQVVLFPCTRTFCCLVERTVADVSLMALNCHVGDKQAVPSNSRAFPLIPERGNKYLQPESFSGDFNIATGERSFDSWLNVIELLIFQPSYASNDHWE